MPLDSSLVRRPWFWPAILAIAVVAGAILQWLREPGVPGPGAPRANVSSPAPAPGAPGRGSAAGPGGPSIPPRAAGAPESPPIVHAEIPRAHPAPGTEPPVPLMQNRVMDPKRVLDDSARRWADSVRGVRPEILEQMRLGKLQERERLQQEIARVEESLRAMPGNAALSGQVETLQNNLYYLDRSIAYLERVQTESR